MNFWDTSFSLSNGWAVPITNCTGSAPLLPGSGGCRNRDDPRTGDLAHVLLDQRQHRSIVVRLRLFQGFITMPVMKGPVVTIWKAIYSSG